MGQRSAKNRSASPRNNWSPTLRGAFPSKPVYSLVPDTTIVNHRYDYNRAQKINNQAASVAAGSYSFGAAKRLSTFDGNAARKLNNSTAPKPRFNPDFSPKPSKKRKVQLEAVRGKKRNGGILEGTAISPMLITVAKFVAAIVVVAAVTAFCRVAISTASISTNMQSKELSTQISEKLAIKNQLEVADSAIANSSHIRSEAEKYSLVAPSTIEQINLGQDAIAYDENGKISLVESLNRVSKA